MGADPYASPLPSPGPAHRFVARGERLSSWAVVLGVVSVAVALLDYTLNARGEFFSFRIGAFEALPAVVGGVASLFALVALGVERRWRRSLLALCLGVTAVLIPVFLAATITVTLILVVVGVIALALGIGS